MFNIDKLLESLKLKKSLDDKIIGAQQGELDAVLLYETLADVVRSRNQELADTFQHVASQENSHAKVCQKITGKTGMKANPLKANFVSAVYKVNPWAAFKMLSIGEYKAAKDYAPVVLDYPTIEPVMKDEIRHGKIFDECIEKYC